MTKGLRVAVCDTPKKVERTLSRKLQKAGHDVVYAGPLRDMKADDDKRTTSAQTLKLLGEADVWLTKWSFCLRGEEMIFNEVKPRLGIITMSVGTDHMDLQAIEGLEMRVENCPTFCSNSVAEHAMALATRGLYHDSHYALSPLPTGEAMSTVPSNGQTEIAQMQGHYHDSHYALPPLSTGNVAFTNFSDTYAESAVTQMLWRVRQLDESVLRARTYDYDRYDNPWKNEELASARIGIVGNERSSSKLAKILKKGFNCELLGCGASSALAAYRIANMSLPEVIDKANYIFVCGDGYGDLHAANIIDSPRELRQPHLEMFGSTVAVLGTGRIGSLIAIMASDGFNCRVRAFSTTRKESLLEKGIEYFDTIEETVSKANFTFIALPLTGKTEHLLGEKALSQLSVDSPHVIVNVTRDEIVDSAYLLDCISRGVIMAYGTDVLPKDKVLWARKKPDVLTKKFVKHSSVVPTPHEGDASRRSLERLCQEAIAKLLMFIK
jgi:lactate dehydrogenase-like 2-hydroxyacid dehydrogenase